MASQLFEAPSHEAHYSSPEAHYGSPEAHELEWEVESGEAHYSSPEAQYSSPEAHELEWEVESGEAQYSSPEAHEMEWEVEAGEAHYSSPEASGYSNPEFEFEGGAHEHHYSNPEHHYSNPEFEMEYEYELEGEYFFGALKKIAKRVGRVVAPLAKKFAPGLARTLVGMIPGVGGLLAPVAGQLVQQLVREAEAEAEAMEAAFFGTGEGEFEVAHTEAAHEAALAEVLAAQAAESAHEAEAEALINTSLPVVISITVGGRRATRRVMPVLAQINRRIVRAIRTAGPDTRQLLRVMPQIQQRTAIALRNAQRRGVKVTGPLAVRTMATVAQRVLSNTPAVARAIERNIQVRNTVAPAHKHPANVARCASCVGQGRAAAAARTAVRPPNGAIPRRTPAPYATAARRPTPR
jgi:hypothetical protein